MSAANQTGADALIGYDFNTWAAYLKHGFTEFIEVDFDEAVYAKAVEIGAWVPRARARA